MFFLASQSAVLVGTSGFSGTASIAGPSIPRSLSESDNKWEPGAKSELIVSGSRGEARAVGDELGRSKYAIKSGSIPKGEAGTGKAIGACLGAEWTALGLPNGEKIGAKLYLSREVG